MDSEIVHPVVRISATLPPVRTPYC